MHHPIYSLDIGFNTNVMKYIHVRSIHMNKNTIHIEKKCNETQTNMDYLYSIVLRLITQMLHPTTYTNTKLNVSMP
jgi:hypothetical protein